MGNLFGDTDSSDDDIIYGDAGDFDSELMTASFGKYGKMMKKIKDFQKVLISLAFVLLVQFPAMMLILKKNASM